MGRAPCCDKANVKKGPWSPQEDATLKSHIEKHGTGGNWIALPHKIGLKRCGKSCRLRWLNYLRPNIKHGGFTEDEDNLICTLYNTIGSRWSIIAAQLPGRTDNDIKNYWNTRLKKKHLGKHRRSQHQAAAAANKCPPPPDQTLIMPHLEASDFHYCNNIIPQQNNQANISEVNFQYPMWDNSTFIIDPSINLPYTGAAMPQLGAAAAITSSSVEYMSWGDTNPNSLIYPQSNYQIWTLFDDPMLLGYS